MKTSDEKTKIFKTRPFRSFGHSAQYYIAISQPFLQLQKVNQTNPQTSPYFLKEIREITLFPTGHLLSSDLDEFLQQLHTLAQLAAEQDLRGHPQLDLITSLEQKAEVHRVLPTSLPAEREVDQLLLKETC